MAITINGTGGIADVNGTAANPAITGADADTGVYFGTNLVGLSTNGTSALYVDSSQNVGIGTSSPATYGKLAVYASGSGIAQTNGTVTVETYIDGTGGYLGTATNHPLMFFTNNSAERMRIDTSGYLSGTVNSLSSGLYQASQYYRLNSTYAGSNATGAQSLLGVGVTLAGSTVYEFEIVVGMIKTAGATSHTISLLFGGTATLNNIGYNVTGSLNATASYAAANLVVYTYQSASASQATTSAGVAGLTATIIAKGTVSVNAGGTFIPQYSLSAAPGGAYTTQIGSYMKISPLGASGANINIGSWA